MYDEILEVCQRAVRQGGRLLREMQQSLNPREKAPRDLVTEADLASQQAIHQILTTACPDFHFIGEEDNVGRDVANVSSEYCWVVDPLDGTTNYVHGLDNYSVSVALQHGPQAVVGAVYDPVREELFTAIAGQGAYRNGERLQTSDIVTLDRALVAASFSARVSRDSPEIKRFIAALLRCQALRRLGSAALNLCYVASSQLDAYWATSVKKWDVAAGILFVQEAGGVITDIDGRPFSLDDPRFIVASTEKLHAELLELLNQAIR